MNTTTVFKPTGLDEISLKAWLSTFDTEPIVMRTSERSNFKRCRRLWDFTSQNRRNLEPTKMNHNLAFGIAIHVGLEHYYDPEGWDFPTDVKVAKAISAFVDENNRQRDEESKAKGGLDDERIAEYKEREELGTAMLGGYGKWASERDDFRPVAVEERFRIPIPTEDGSLLIVGGRPVLYQVRVDLLTRDEDGGLWIADHKTAGKQDNLTFLELDTQLSSYVWAATLYYGEQVRGFMYNELFKKAPHPPKVLAKGGLSQDKRQNTTYELYEQTIREHGLDPAPYDGMLKYLREQPNDYFRRTQQHRSAREIAVQGTYVLAEARDMYDNPSIYPNTHKFNCNSCDFLAPSIVASEGGDVEFMLNDPMMFRQRVSEEDERE